MKTKYYIVDIIAVILVIIGALNWGLVGVFDFNVITKLFGDFPLVTRIIYMVVGVAGLWMIYSFSRCCCSKSTECH